MAASRVAVVGAGLAGLSAAVALQRLGYAVEVFERSRLLGGKATSFIVDGVEVDNGQHVFLGCCTEFIDFVTDLGMANKLHLQERFEALVLRPGAPPCRLRAAALPAPLHLAPALFGYCALGWAGKLQVAWALARARQAPRPGETFAAWLARQRQGERARRYFWDLFVVPALNAPLDVVAAEAALFVINTAFGGDRAAARFGFVDVPLARIAEAAAERIGAVHRRTAVTGLWEDAGRVRGVRLGPEQTLPFDAVVLAVPPRTAARLLGEPERFGVEGLDAFTAQAIVDVHLWYDREHFDFGFAALPDSPVQWVFQKAPGYLCCSLSAAGELVSRPQEELVERCHGVLAGVLPAVAAARLRRGAATRDPEATFVPRPGLRRPGPATSAPNVVLAGAWTDTGWPATMESAVRSGGAAARLLAERGGARAA